MSSLIFSLAENVDSFSFYGTLSTFEQLDWLKSQEELAANFTFVWMLSLAVYLKETYIWFKHETAREVDIDELKDFLLNGNEETDYVLKQVRATLV